MQKRRSLAAVVAVWLGLTAVAAAQEQTLLYILPDKGLAVVLMANLEGSRLQDLAHQIGEIVGE